MRPSLAVLPSTSSHVSHDQMSSEEQKEFDEAIAITKDDGAIPTDEEVLSSEESDVESSQAEEDISGPPQGGDEDDTQEAPKSPVCPDGANVSSSLVESVFSRPSESSTAKTKLDFIGKHPIQPDPVHLKLPFDSKKIYYRTQPEGEKIQRKWLSYSCQTNRIYCSFCMCYEKFSSKSPFASFGYDVNVKYVYEKVAKHEESKGHVNSVKSYIAALSQKDVRSLIDKEGISRRQAEVQQNRMVIHRIIDIILFLAKQNIAFRGHRNKGAASLEDSGANHGNFLEMVVLLSKYDKVLKRHVDKVVKKSKQQKMLPGSKRKGRGALVTFLSKKSIAKLLKICSDSIRRCIVNDILMAGKFSVQMDSTQDVSVTDQLAIVLRYVKSGAAHEHLYKVTTVKGSATALNLHDALKAEFDKDGLEMRNLIGDSFDGASNMSGVHSGLQAEICKASPESVYIHCYGHVLNLVMSKCTSDSGESRRLFGLLTSTAVFMSQSHKRMDTWKETIPGSHWKLQKIGETRWWSKDVALKNVFGSYESPNPERLETLLKALKLIESSKAFDPKATFEASALRQSWERFETILCAFVFLKIFQYSTPVSKYLQTSGLDVMTAYTMADNLSKTLTVVRDQFSEVHQKAAKFANDVAEQGVDVAHELQCIRKRKKKRLSTEESNDDVEALGSSLRKFEIETYKATVDVASAEIDRRFSKNRDLYQDLAVPEPRRFADTKVMLESNKSLLSKIS